MGTESIAGLFLTPDIQVRKADEALYLEANQRLGKLPASVFSYLYHWAQERPETVFLAERNSADPHQWDRISYAETLARTRLLAAALAAAGVSPQRPLMLLSGNSISFALLTLAAMMINAPVVPVSPSYSLLSGDFGKVRYIHDLVNPGLVFAQDAERFQGVLRMLRELGTPLLTQGPETAGITTLEQLLADGASRDDNRPLPEPDPDTVAKILFTSGSTGMPKGVINTQRMLVSNQEAIAAIWPFLEQPGHLLLDWLPWHHTFGGNHNFNMALRNGASLYIDAGKPTPEAIETTLVNLAEVSPTLYFNVPAGYQLLVGHLEQDAALAARFFKNLRLIFFAAAALPTPVWQRLEALIEQHSGREIPITSSWGATETAPLCTSVYFANRIARNIGVPIPGTAVKLAPVGEMLELRVKGPNVMPGYWRDEEKTREVFDEEGYFCSGDAVTLLDPDDPARGLLFKGRVNENFKLCTGTWVNVGELRVKLVEALAPLATDLVICGENEGYLAVLIFPNKAECLPYLQALPDRELAAHPALQQEIARRLERHNAAHPTSSQQIMRALVLASPPSFDSNEITDKGYLNQRGVILNRAAEVEALYDPQPAARVISVAQSTT